MECRCDHKPTDNDEHEPGVQRIEAGEELAASGLRRVDRTHAAEQHRAVEERGDPLEALEYAVTRHADRERDREDQTRQASVLDKPKDELSARQQRLMAMLVHEPNVGSAPCAGKGRA